jgi:sortase B
LQEQYEIEMVRGIPSNAIQAPTIEEGTGMKVLRKVLIVILLVVFLGSAGMVARTLWQYRAAEQLYEESAQQYTTVIEQTEPPADTQEEESSSLTPEQAEVERAPIQVDFDALQQVNPQVVGWIYCPDTVINYPVVQGTDDEYYLHRAYDGTYSSSGSIFVEAENQANFQDSNTIIYGHHMKNQTMFATLSKWFDQSYYEAHPVMWLLTPEQDYKLVLFSGYTTSATSSTYTVYSGGGQTFLNYLEQALNRSEFQTQFQPEEDGHYVVLSTCAYVFDDARYVLHGQLVPVASAGGVPTDEAD